LKRIGKGTEDQWKKEEGNCSGTWAIAIEGKEEKAERKQKKEREEAEAEAEAEEADHTDSH
jgi:hypothetical protein